MNLKYKAMLFDFDGTLIDSESFFLKAAQYVLDKFGHTYTPTMHRQFLCLGTLEAAQTIVDKYSLNISALDFIEQRDEQMKSYCSHINDLEGVHSFFKILKSLGLKIGLVTNSDRKYVMNKLKFRTWASSVNVVVCGDDIPYSQRKPNPEIYLNCAKKLGVSEKECLVFEDSPIGIKASKSAAMDYIAVVSELLPILEKDELLDAKAIISDFSKKELIKVHNVLKGEQIGCLSSVAEA